MDEHEEIKNYSKCYECFEKRNDACQLAKMKKMEQCECGCIYYCSSDDVMIKHYDSKLHKKRMAIQGKITDISFLTIKKLHEIVKANLNENGTAKIPNYTRMKKEELAEKLKAIKDLIIPDSVEISK